WVDVLYNQKKSEHAKALYHLSKLFKDRQDEKKAKDCRDRLEKDKAFAGSEYQRLIVNEKEGGRWSEDKVQWRRATTSALKLSLTKVYRPPRAVYGMPVLRCWRRIANTCC